ncbi:LRR and CARD domains-containing protein 3) (Nucleotide-binding oligomerization domain protein 3) [Durusdinium trenchii]|uniref:LRR and CARD domains-containing protein 3 (Nucleotide-binding oligomerization domain protein 3 n=1 Tax=Durusdinium trenchii TaxID=1381693 RepID=A0ABP0RKB1_9DINO
MGVTHKRPGAFQQSFTTRARRGAAGSSVRGARLERPWGWDLVIDLDQQHLTMNRMDDAKKLWVFRVLTDRHDHLERRFHRGRYFYRYGFNFTSKKAETAEGGTLWQINTNGEVGGASTVVSCHPDSMGPDIIVFQQVGLPMTCPLEGRRGPSGSEDGFMRSVADLYSMLEFFLELPDEVDSFRRSFGRSCREATSSLDVFLRREPDMAEHVSQHFTSYWSFDQFSQQLAIHGFELRILVSMLKRLGRNLAEWGAERLTPARVRALELQHTDLADTGTVILAEAIKVNHTVSHVALRSSLGRRSGERVASLRNLIAKRGATALAEALRSNETLESLDMNSNEIGERGAEELAEALRVNKTLDTLDLGNNQQLGEKRIMRLGPKGLVPLAELLRRNRNRSLRHLALGNNNIGPDAIVFLAGVLKKNHTLVDLSLNVNDVGDKGAEALGEALSSNSCLQRLDLSNNGIKAAGPSGAAELNNSCGAVLVLFGLAQLIMELNPIGVAGATVLMEVLRVHPALQFLDMRLTDLGNEGCIQVAEGLKVSQALQHLDLSYNQIYDRGGVALADALRQNRSLQDLLLRTNQLGDAGVIALADAIHKHRTLQSGVAALARSLQKSKALLQLSLDLNCIKNQGAADLAQALTVNRSLLILRICSNEIGEQGAVALADALRQNCTLQQLIASSNLFGQHGATALGSALRHGAQQLQTLDLRSNGLGDPGAPWRMSEGSGGGSVELRRNRGSTLG